MLKQLHIKNFTLIEQLDMTFYPGFSVITGETGAGKSIILGAIGLLTGNRADSKQIMVGKDRCIVEASFDMRHYNLAEFFETNDIEYDETDCIMRREMTASGKSRAFINDTPVPLTVMKALGERLIDIHSQHQNLLLQKEDFQLSVIDIMAKDAEQKTAYTEAFNKYKETERKLHALKAQAAKAKENEDFLRYQFEELEKAQLTEDAQSKLEQESQLLSHAEDIKTALYEADNAFFGDESGIVECLATIMQALRNIERVYEPAQELRERLNSTYIEIKDIGSEISHAMEDVAVDPERLDDINQRLDTIYSLEKKHRMSSTSELIALKKELEKQLHSIDFSDEEAAQLEQQLQESLTACTQKAAKLSACRKKAAAQIEKQMKETLIPLGIPNVSFEIQFREKPLSADGTDKVQYLFSANKNTAAMPVADVASGGEIARVMLSLKAMISGAVKQPTIIFDEIDTGVSGKVAEKMAQIMQAMGKNNRQVISITHLPQIAAMGTTHYKVSKTDNQQGTTTTMTMLSSNERIEEIAQMLSGSNVSEAAIQNAKTLLGI